MWSLKRDKPNFGQIRNYRRLKTRASSAKVVPLFFYSFKREIANRKVNKK